MTRYMCLESGEVFDDKTKANEHTQTVHNQSFSNALKIGLLIELDENTDPEEAYREHVE